MLDGLLGNKPQPVKPQPVKMFSTCFYYFTVKYSKNVDDGDGGARSSFNVCVCVFQAQIDHYLALVNNQIKDVVGK